MFIKKNSERASDMNILYLSRTMGQGGAEKIVFQLATEEAIRGAKVLVASCGGVYVKQLEINKIRHIQVDDLECKNPGTVLRTLKILINVIREEEIELIHTHHRMAQFYASVLHILFPRVRILYTAHNVFFDKIAFTRRILQHTSIVAVGNGVKENLVHIFQVKPDCIQVIYNGVSVEKPDLCYENETLKELGAQGNFLLGVIGRISKQKGMDIFVSVCKQLKLRGIPVKGVIIGDGEDKKEIEQQIERTGLSQDILLMGYQNHIPSLITQLDLVMMPSRWEGFPLLPFEVFAANKTIVASDIAGISEIVHDMENGILVSKDDVNDFTEAIICLYQNKNLKRELEEKGRYTFQRFHSYEYFVSQYHRKYQELMEGES
ncbi:MAG: glycosyltransferase family 4 protein [Fusicatenibacter sp.]|nr:glycosyltransferase family 4 protein [Fusicatenibacter sp.]